MTGEQDLPQLSRKNEIPTAARKAGSDIEENPHSEMVDEEVLCEKCLKYHGYKKEKKEVFVA
jgi:hypothetical protein